jgi:hypothetical protein
MVGDAWNCGTKLLLILWPVVTRLKNVARSGHEVV